MKLDRIGEVSGLDVLDAALVHETSRHKIGSG
jgi:hypothetical protein